MAIGICRSESRRYRCDAAGVEGDDEVGDGGGELALMGSENNCPVGLAEAGEERDHLARAFDIHVGERLVEQEQLGDGKQHAGERGALAHALRILADEAIEIGIEADLTKRVGGREAGAAGIKTAEVAKIFLGGELVIEHGRVAHVADAGAGFMRLRFAEDCDRAVRGTKKAGENAQQRGFSGAVFTEENIAAARLEDRERPGGERQSCRRVWRLGRAARLWVLRFLVAGFRVVPIRPGGIGMNVCGSAGGFGCVRRHAVSWRRAVASRQARMREPMRCSVLRRE